MKRLSRRMKPKNKRKKQMRTKSKTRKLRRRMRRKVKILQRSLNNSPIWIWRTLWNSLLRRSTPKFSCLATTTSTESTRVPTTGAPSSTWLLKASPLFSTLILTFRPKGHLCIGMVTCVMTPTTSSEDTKKKCLGGSDLVRLPEMSACGASTESNQTLFSKVD